MENNLTELVPCADQPFSDLLFLRAIYAIRDACEARAGRPQLFISHWDPDPGFSESIVQLLQIDAKTLSPQARYIYPSQVEGVEACLMQLGFDAKTKSALICPTGTNSMNCIIAFLKLSGLRNIFFIYPNYFSSFETCKIFGIPARQICVSADMSMADILDGIGQLPDNAALWVSNPLYGTSNSITDTDANRLISLMDSGVYVIADECLAVPEQELGRRIGSHERFIGYYSPHKSLTLNDYKFSAIAFQKSAHNLFYGIGDLYFGGLPPSSVSALKHFLSPNFVILSRHAETWRKDGLHKLSQVINRFPECTLYDSKDGIFVTVSIKALPGHLNSDFDFVRKLGNETGLIIMTGAWGGFHSSFGFCFRINIYKLNDGACEVLERALRWLSSQA